MVWNLRHSLKKYSKVVFIILLWVSFYKLFHYHSHGEQWVTETVFHQEIQTVQIWTVPSNKIVFLNIYIFWIFRASFTTFLLLLLQHSTPFYEWSICMCGLVTLCYKQKFKIQIGCIPWSLLYGLKGLKTSMACFLPML